MKPRTVRRRLEESLTDGRIATVVRDGFEVSVTDGFVVALTDEWVVLNELVDGVHLDGLVLLRLEDVTQVWFRDDDAYHHRAVEALGVPVQTFACEADDGAGKFLAAPLARSEVVTLRFEILRGEPLVIGRLLRLGRKKLTLHYLGRDGVWAPQTEKWRLRDGTPIELGGRYVDALNRFGDPYPVLA